MLTLERSLTIEAGNRPITVYRDDVAAHRFYVLPDEPRIAKDEDGNAIFSLIVYRTDEEQLSDDQKGDLGGGIMTFTAELAFDTEDFDDVKRKLISVAFGDEEEADELEVDLDYVPFIEGRVRVALAGEVGDKPGQFVDSIIGEGKVSAIGSNRKAVMAKLTQAGASLFSQLKDLPTLPINLEYNLTFEHRLVGVKMRVFCNMETGYKLAKEFIHHRVTEDDGCGSKSYREDRVREVHQELRTSKVCGVEVTPLTSEIDSDTLLALEKFGFDMLERETQRAVQLQIANEKQITDHWLKEFTIDSRNDFNFELTRQMVLERDYFPSANVSNMLRARDDLITFIDLRTDFFSRLEVPVRVNADFGKLPLDSVTVHIEYTRERIGGGGTEDISESFNYTDGTTINKFVTFANRLEDVEYTWVGGRPLHRFGRYLRDRSRDHIGDVPGSRCRQGRIAARRCRARSSRPRRVSDGEDLIALHLRQAARDLREGVHPQQGPADRRLVRGRARDARGIFLQSRLARP